MDENVAELRQAVAGQRILHTTLALSFVAGLAAHTGGYALLQSDPGEPLGLFAELLLAMGWSLWTGVVVVVFTQIIPKVKRRQIMQAIEEYDSWRRDRALAEQRSERKSQRA
jgi:hypothetical protein